jgi:transcriptional regulator with XRE-family HTH domain
MLAIRKIEEVRKQRKVSQKILCEYIGMTTAGYQNMISLDDMKLSTLIRIAEFYKMPVEWFVSDSQAEDQIERDIDRIFDAMKEVVKEKIIKK